MITIQERNVNGAYLSALVWLRHEGYFSRRLTRDGEAHVLHEPVSTRYDRPQERVLFDPHRDANPFFHLLEALWMLAGRRDVAWLSRWLPRMATYSDDGLVFHGAYGWRWRQHFGFDQLEACIARLRADAGSRQAVIAMWDPRADLHQTSRDLPCNNLIKFDVRGGQLCMMVSCRSNDAIMGCYGANVVHLSVLQEYMACRLRLPMGWYEQVSLDFHAYVRDLSRLPTHSVPHDYYAERATVPFPLMTVAPEVWEHDLQKFLACAGRADVRYDDPFFDRVAGPMAMAYANHKGQDYAAARDYAASMAPCDWQTAALQWIERRALRRVSATVAPAAAPTTPDDEDGLIT